MSKIRLHGSSSGYTEIAPVAASGNNTLTLPNDGTIISKDSAGAIGVTSVHTTNITATGIATITTAKIGAGVTISESGIEASGIGITCANINGGQIGGRRNIVINGAMQVAQRGTSSTTSGMQTIDRFNCSFSGTDEALTQEQADVSSGTTPYTLGFRKSYKITNGNQTSGAGASDAVLIEYKSESQDIATSGWNFKSATSFITMSFWVKSSVAQEFQCQLYNADANKAYLFTYTVSSADTWQKITHSVKGDSNLNFNVDNGAGLECAWYLFIGTDQTVASPTENTWATYSGTSTKKDAVSTWYTTNDATFELTGVQWEVGSQATAFEHRSFGEELDSCFRYCQVFDSVDGEYNRFAYANAASGSSIRVIFPLMREMRAKPSVAFSGNFQCPGVGSFNINNVIMESNTGSRKVACLQHGSVSVTSYQTYQFNANGDTSAKVTYTAEL